MNQQKFGYDLTISINMGIAERFTLNTAMIIEELAYRINDHKQKEYDNLYHDGVYWVYRSAKVLAKKFSCINQQTIAKILRTLESDGIIVSRYDLDNSFTKVKYYAISDPDLCEFYSFDIPTLATDTDIPIEAPTIPIEALVTTPDTLSKPKPIKKRIEPKTKPIILTVEDGIPESVFLDFVEEHTETIVTDKIVQKKATLRKLYVGDDEDEFDIDQYELTVSLTSVYESIVNRKHGYTNFRDTAPHTIHEYMDEYLDFQIFDRTQWKKRMA